MGRKPKKAEEPDDRLARPVRLTPKLLKELQHQTIERDIKQQDAIVEGIILWLAGKPLVNPDSLEPEDRALALVFPRFIKEAKPELVELVRELVRAGLSTKRAVKP